MLYALCLPLRYSRAVRRDKHCHWLKVRSVRTKLVAVERRCFWEQRGWFTLCTGQPNYKLRT